MYRLDTHLSSSLYSILSILECAAYFLCLGFLFTGYAVGELGQSIFAASFELSYLLIDNIL